MRVEVKRMKKPNSQEETTLSNQCRPVDGAYVSQVIEEFLKVSLSLNIITGYKTDLFCQNSLRFQNGYQI